MTEKKTKPSYLLIDLGAVIYDIDYQKTIQELSDLFDSDLESFFSKQEQSKFVDLFEEGKISPEEFCECLKQRINCFDVDNDSIKTAWNALLIGFRQDTVEYLQSLSKRLDLYLYSNTNEFHYNELSKRAGDEFMKDFHNCFKRVYLSHTFNFRKPHPESFLELLKRENLKPEEGLFIDDTLHHIRGAAKTGLQVYHFQTEDRLEDILPKLC